LEDTELPEKTLVFHREVEIPSESSIDGKKIRDLDLPEDCVLVKIIRNREIILPRGNTLLHVGDIVEIFGMKDKLVEAEKHLSS
jgi:trk system potassium uptake protein TrkA